MLFKYVQIIMLDKNRHLFEITLFVGEKDDHKINLNANLLVLIVQC